MSNEQRKILGNFFTETFKWLSRGAVALGIWFLSEIYHDFQNVKFDLQQVKSEMSSMKTSLDIMKSYDLKPKQ